MIQWFRVPLILLEDPSSQKPTQVVHNSLLIPVPRNSGPPWNWHILTPIHTIINKNFKLKSKIKQNITRTWRQLSNYLFKSHITGGSQKTQVWFLAPTWWLPVIWNSSSRGSDMLLWPVWAPACTWYTYTHSGSCTCI